MATKKKSKKVVKHESFVRIDAFDFEPGRVVAQKYEIVRKLGCGWESEVYLLRELSTGIERAGKFFFPHRNDKNRAATRYATKLHKLRHCPILIQYHTQESIVFRRQDITFLVSEYVEGELLSDFLNQQPGKRLGAFQALHLLYALSRGVEQVHALREYHGDLHSQNVIVHRYGLGFELKLLDMFHRPPPSTDNIQDDVCNMIRIFYDSLGGQQHYAKQPAIVKYLCCGLKNSLILERFRNAGQLRQILETLEW